MGKKPRSETLVTFGRLVRIYRDAAGLTQKELAKTLDYTNGWVSNVETGQLRPRVEQVRLLEQALNLPPGALMAVDAKVMHARLEHLVNPVSPPRLCGKPIGHVGSH